MALTALAATNEEEDIRDPSYREESLPPSEDEESEGEGRGHERYFLLVVDVYSRYTTVFPLHSKDRGGEFSSDLLRAFYRSQGIRQTFTLPASPQKNGIAEHRIGMVMDVARTSMIHAASPHFLWPFAVRYAAHQINLQPRVSLLETTPTLRWTGKVGDASAFRVWGSRAFVRDTTADKLSSRAVPCFFLGFPPDAPGWQFYHPTSRRVLSSQDVTFDESVSYYHPAEPVEVAVDSGAESGVAEPAGAETGDAESGGDESGRAVPGGAEPRRVEPEGTVSGGAEPARAASGGALGVLPRREPLSPQQLREWYSRRYQGAAGATRGPAGTFGGAAGAGAAGGAAGAGAAGGAAGAGAAGGAAGTGDPGAKGTCSGYTFSLGSDSVSWRSTRSSSVLSSSCEAEIYAGAMAAQELRWLTYLLTDLGEAPHSPPVLYVDNKAMLALCQEHRLEHRTKHIALRYFLARELQQHGQLHLALRGLSGQHC
ncbi:unnamed protein product [Closterium sp. NIES-53]